MTSPALDDTSRLGWSARRDALLRSESARRRVGRIMVATAVVTVLIVVVTTAVLWRLIGAVNRTSVETLDVTVDALSSLESTVELADDLIGSTSESLAAVEVTLGTVGGSFESGSRTVSDIGELTSTAEPTLRNAQETLRVLEGLGGNIDGVLVGLSALPLGPNYDPQAGLGVTFGRLADDLAPLPDEFAATSQGLADFEGDLDRLQSDVGALTATVAALNDDLAESESLIAQYRANVGRAQDVAEQSRQDLDRDYTLLRLLLVVAAANFALSQLVPLWIGWELLHGNRAPAVL